MKWTYLTDILTVNGQPTDYAQRYPAPADPHHRLTLARLPVPGAFDPAEEEDNCGGFVGVDVRVSLRMYVLPEEVGDPMALYEALANRLEREFAALRYTVPAAL
ncbi:hypothetical protein OH782_42315 (plasmid) [Streptomyces sp. NBC_01544]|uniref:hypothetical protein n=1 Tax=Streptomyces sp. NBC_01544 TaxID=2975871 RepID=UPI00386AF85D